MNTTPELNGRCVLIIGGSSGFGLEVAGRLAASGVTLHLVGRDTDKANKLAAQLGAGGAKVHGHGLDASDPAALQPLLQTLGRIDHAVSMVGGAMGGGFLDAPLDTITQAIEDKFFSNLRIARTLAPFMAEQGSLTLTAGSGGRPHNASGALIGNQAIATLVQGLAVEMAPSVRVNAVAPTWTPTPLWRNMTQEQIDSIEQSLAARIPLRRVAQLREIAEAYLFLIRCSFITGQTLVVDGGLSLVE